ncbi:LysR family transcriptional regulator [Desulfosporosinus sp. PR]|uniref:LysR family transcriptional regulator n=1 Tax=Candidatus Desulfosporosinus nitrosoreducens TaxID=3401928 RepID=UPI0027F42586|nr:LysR family transcriptional regulator [Desulfosporosinus sp. PR]MDQ7093481.1 LysR family transcriptional regulator [Desulfosporosinus sp. PR]
MYNRQLDTFIQVADAGSFAKAAQSLFISSTAIIKQINLLEKDLGLQLLIRTHRGVILTEAGKSLYKDSKYIIQYAKDSLARARNAAQSSNNIIRIGTSFMTPSQFLLELWPQIQEHCPNLKFQLIPFENTPENAAEILANLGRKIDLVAGLIDGNIREYRGCDALELYKTPICCAVSIHHRLAKKDRLTIQDLFGENFMLIRRGWNSYVDLLRDDIWRNYPQITVQDFQFYDVSVFNQCENSNDVLMAVGIWENVHPLLKILPVEWEHQIPFGLLYSPSPSDSVLSLIYAVSQVFDLKK